MDAFTRSYEKFGLHPTPEGILYHEWAPNAKAAFLMGEFNDWNQTSHPMKKLDFGHWEILVPNKADGSAGIPHNTKIKVSFELEGGQRIYRIPSWITRATQDLNGGFGDGYELVTTDSLITNCSSSTQQ